VTRFKFWGPNDISEMAEAKIVEFCTQVDYTSIKSYISDNKPPLKGRGQGHMTSFQFRCQQSYLRNG